MFVLPIEEELDMKKAAKAVGEKSVSMIHVKILRQLPVMSGAAVLP